ncbi:glycosyltransferase family 2 protein [Erwinia mallotivora]|uniref:Glycosyltransferase n=1 Tax=Erwinia mallotivora TaxID=69222 RepID=A0A014LWK4_9GAMM|nr:glycosyltransferase family 2 protein [Erwinia mallotivora]EXU73976.1 glycosyltransferase [Erwinia mallotivora]
MNEKIMFSIVIPVYNAQNTIHRTLLSVLNQSYTDYEVVIVNDGSTDKSATILEEFNGHKQIKVIPQVNGGVSSARNTGLKNCAGEYVIFLDSDDWVDDNFLLIFKENLNSFKDNSVDLIIGNLKDERIRPVTQYGFFSAEDIPVIIGELEVTDNIGYLHNKCYRKKIIDDSGMCFQEGVSMSEDLLFNLRYICQVNNLLVISSSSYHYENLSGSLSKKRVSHDELLLRKKHLADTYDAIIKKYKNSNLKYFMKGISRRMLALDMQIVTSMYYSSFPQSGILAEIKNLKKRKYPKGIFNLLNRNEKVKFFIMRLNSISAYYALGILYRMHFF